MSFLARKLRRKLHPKTEMDKMTAKLSTTSLEEIFKIPISFVHLDLKFDCILEFKSPNKVKFFRQGVVKDFTFGDSYIIVIGSYTVTACFCGLFTKFIIRTASECVRNFYCFAEYDPFSLPSYFCAVDCVSGAPQSLVDMYEIMKSSCGEVLY